MKNMEIQNIQSEDIGENSLYCTFEKPANSQDQTQHSGVLMFVVFKHLNEIKLL